MARRTLADIRGLDELRRAVRELEKVPTKVASKAARAGGKIALASARSSAPKETGALKKGIIMRAERTRKRGKKVFDIKIDPKNNDIFVKETRNGRKYYPASQEYGFLTVNGKFIEGKRYLRKAITDNEREIERAIVRMGLQEINKALNER
ncbi:HK97 gp10 family phage protein [Paenibacillus sp. sgz302251]|uniref:HK97 gp10 family phage protein n=1 Tax=Paenibacillus sp. sgz302251 TaxID=3414493 RepID=UPI003C7C7556